MKKSTTLFLFLLIGPLLCLSACDDDPIPANLIVTSLAFGEGQVIPDIHTCFGSGVSPALFIENPPEGTAQFALILEDTDQASLENTLWILWQIQPDTGAVPHEVPRGSYEADDLRQGRSDDLEVGYLPPCPPAGETRTYRFRAFALDLLDIPGLDYAVDRHEFDKRIEGHILDSGNLTFDVLGR